jgi:hypothetical protein
MMRKGHGRKEPYSIRGAIQADAWSEQEEWKSYTG